MPRALAELQRNATAALQSMAGQLAAAHARLDAHLNGTEAVLAPHAAMNFCPGPVIHHAIPPPLVLPQGPAVHGPGGSSIASPLQRLQTCGTSPELMSLARELDRAQDALAAAERREAAVLFAVPFLGGLLALNLPGMDSKPLLFRAAVMTLIVADGIVGLLLQLRVALPGGLATIVGNLGHDTA